jgi:hypothetical protein
LESTGENSKRARVPNSNRFPTSLLRALPDPLATHRVNEQIRRWVVAVAHEITDNRILTNDELTGTGRVILEECITVVRGSLHIDPEQRIGVTDVEVAADIHIEQSYPACRASDGQVPVYGYCLRCSKFDDTKHAVAQGDCSACAVVLSNRIESQRRHAPRPC